MIAAPKIAVHGDLEGGMHVGFDRTDVPLFHTIARAEPGTRFSVTAHFANCNVCRMHGFTETDFITQWKALLEARNGKSEA